MLNDGIKNKISTRKTVKKIIHEINILPNEKKIKKYICEG